MIKDIYWKMESKVMHMDIIKSTHQNNLNDKVN